MIFERREHKFKKIRVTKKENENEYEQNEAEIITLASR